MNKILLAAAALAVALPAAPAAADPPPWAPAHGWRAKNRAHSYGYQDGYYGQSRYDGGNYRRCSGTTGTVVGGAVGALAGREIDRRGSRTTGTILGAAAGALLGREVGRSTCRR
jgi:opacity protein-like surface antigen